MKSTMSSKVITRDGLQRLQNQSHDLSKSDKAQGENQWEMNVALVIEELVRRYQDLAKRSSELRSYL